MRQAAYRWHDFYLGLIMEQRKSTKDIKGKAQEGQTPLRLNTDAPPMIVGPNVDDAITNLVSIGGDDPYTYVDESIPNTEISPNTFYSPTYLSNVDAINAQEKDLDYWIRVGINYAIQNQEYAYGENLLLPFKKWKWQELLFGLYVKSNQLSKSRALLNVLP